jgi:hypothetical protein
MFDGNEFPFSTNTEKERVPNSKSTLVPGKNFFHASLPGGSATGRITPHLSGGVRRIQPAEVPSAKAGTAASSSGM